MGATVDIVERRLRHNWDHLCLLDYSLPAPIPFQQEVYIWLQGWLQAMQAQEMPTDEETLVCPGSRPVCPP